MSGAQPSIALAGRRGGAGQRAFWESGRGIATIVLLAALLAFLLWAGVCVAIVCVLREVAPFGIPI